MIRAVDHTFSVPLRHDEVDGERLELYARELHAGADRPLLLFLNGGPGFPAPRPMGTEGWLRRALADYRVLFLDQRGTGRSTPANRHTLARIADPAEYLTHFRADSIVRDAELIRRELIGDEPWTVLGQSFGGYCATTYLSFAPHGLCQVFITGGLPSVRAGADEVYRALYPVVEVKNRAHYERFPQDVEEAVRVALHLQDNDVRLPSGRRLTVEAFQLLGNLLGASDGSQQLHYVLEAPFADGRLTDEFLFAVEKQLSWASPFPLFSLLHEATYVGSGPTDWSAHRVRAEFPQFDGADPLLFTGEAIYPWMLDNDPLLRPLAETAHRIAAHRPWPDLYDLDRLRDNTVPVTAAIYANDMYVNRDLSLETAQTIRGVRYWLTDEYEHDGLRVSDGAVLDRLLTRAADDR